MSKKNYDSAFCGSLPLHKINLIQAHGVLLIVGFTDFLIQQVSENVEKLLQKSPAELVDTPLTDYFSPVQLADVKKKFEDASTAKLPYTLTLEWGGVARDFLAIIHRKEDALLIELELSAASDRSAAFTDIYLDLRHAMAAMDQAGDIAGVAAIAAEEIKRVSGFDKVLIYRFDADWNGTVIAEVLEEGMDAYLGLTFPASDIPQQVRNLYLRNPYRMIPDREGEPVGLYPVINPVSQNFVDLSDCDLRMVAGVHVEYMRNMKIMASMSIRIIKDDLLWGLFSCHHRTPRQLSFETCAVLEFLSNILSARITSLHNKERFAALTRLQEVHAKLVEQVYQADDLVEALTTYPVTVLNVLGAEGAVILSEKRIDTIGKTPSKNDIKELVLWLYSNNFAQLYQHDSLASVYDEAAGYASVASGVLSLPLNPEKREYIIAFRPEVLQSIDWGGDPSTALTFDKDNIHYHPRSSFASWQQTVKRTAVAWKSYELEVAESFRNFLLEYKLRKHSF
ncbi:GAF domain-containing protein [Paraflavitalea pollutisoli]|uniref:GAF domain-containing protein n=1 Tax=Paraflavitalea pollutisoli TaxID=3034143 RepID=UPI0023EBBC0F|nr:GAF domain-containing protein [Paraflavitalea sp. H1-2-19X]